jgi:hypothetical protein
MNHNSTVTAPLQCVGADLTSTEQQEHQHSQCHSNCTGDEKCCNGDWTSCRCETVNRLRDPNTLYYSIIDRMLTAMYDCNLKKSQWIRARRELLDLTLVLQNGTLGYFHPRYLNEYIIKETMTEKTVIAGITHYKSHPIWKQETHRADADRIIWLQPKLREQRVYMLQREKQTKAIHPGAVLDYHIPGKAYISVNTSWGGKRMRYLPFMEDVKEIYRQINRFQYYLIVIDREQERVNQLLEAAERTKKGIEAMNQKNLSEMTAEQLDQIAVQLLAAVTAEENQCRENDTQTDHQQTDIFNANFTFYTSTEPINFTRIESVNLARPQPYDAEKEKPQSINGFQRLE